MHFLILALVALALILVFLGLAAAGRAWLGWVLAIGGALFLWGRPAPEHPILFWSVCGVFLLMVALTGIVPLRQVALSGTILKIVGGILPKMSETDDYGNFSSPRLVPYNLGHAVFEFIEAKFG